jgi:hypothetical protein
MKLCEHCPLQPPMKPCRECLKPFRPGKYSGSGSKTFCSPTCRDQFRGRQAVTAREKARARTAIAAPPEPPNAA